MIRIVLMLIASPLNDLCVIFENTHALGWTAERQQKVEQDFAGKNPTPAMLAALKAMPTLEHDRKYAALRAVAPKWRCNYLERELDVPSLMLLAATIEVYGLPMKKPDLVRAATEMPAQDGLIGAAKESDYGTVATLLEHLAAKKHSRVRLRFVNEPKKGGLVSIPALSAAKTKPRKAALELRLVGRPGQQKIDGGHTATIVRAKDGYGLGSSETFLRGDSPELSTAKLAIWKAGFSGNADVAFVADPDAPIESLVRAIETASAAGFRRVFLARIAGKQRVDEASRVATGVRWEKAPLEE